jgi:HEAT repeat protein
MRAARSALLFAGVVLATVLFFRPPAWLSAHHVGSDDPNLLAEAAVSALRDMAATTPHEPLTPVERSAARRFYQLHERLASMGPRAVEPLLTLLNHSEGDVAVWAGGVLGRIGPDAVPGLLRLLRHPDPLLRARALEALRRHPLDATIARAVVEVRVTSDQELLAAYYEFWSELYSRPQAYWDAERFSLANPQFVPRARPLDAAVIEVLAARARASGPLPGNLARVIGRDADPARDPLLAVVFLEALPSNKAAPWPYHRALLGEDDDRRRIAPGEPQTTALVAQGDATDKEIRSAVVRILGRIDDPRAESKAVAALADPDPYVRQAAILGLRFNEALTADALIRFLNDPSNWVFEAALGVMAQRKLKEAFGPIRRAIPRQGVSDKTMWETLWAIDPEAARPLLAGPAAGPNEDLDVRLWAIQRLDDVALVRSLAIEDGRAEVRVGALIRLCGLGPPDLTAFLLDRLDREPSGGSEVRELTATALGKLRAREAVPRLMEHLAESRPTPEGAFPHGCVRALGMIGDPTALESLRRLAPHAGRDPYFGAVLAQARARLGDREVVPELQATLLWSDRGGNPRDILAGGTRRECAELLGRLGESGVAALLEVLAFPQEDLHPYALVGLAASKDPRAWPALEAGMRAAHHAQLRRAAAEGLGNYGDARALPLLARAVEDPSPHVAAAAAIAFQELTGESLGMPDAVADAFDASGRPTFDPNDLIEKVRARR